MRAHQWKLFVIRDVDPMLDERMFVRCKQCKYQSETLSLNRVGDLLNETLPIDVRRWRIQNELTQQEAAMLVGVTVGSWNGWEQGNNPSGEQEEKLRDHLVGGCPVTQQ